MSQEEIQALIYASIAGLKDELMIQVTTANKGLAASLTKEIKKSLLIQNSQSHDIESEEESSKLTLKTLQQQLGELQSQLAQKDKEAFTAKKSQAITQVIAASRTLNTTALQKLISLEYGDYLKEENGSWYVEKGDHVVTLQDALNTYLTTDEGKFYLPPSGVNGSGSTEAKSINVDTNQKVKAADALFDSF
ncbi:hypothetical protein [Anabaena sp. AL93]|uniref:hypothetical protein n=1 Tax=Anabaena sp. AL93 TaxID=1678133 RepID=UPI0007FFB56A|nr:hypothetical protein [Anabaena sp. AL93]OBQ17629.1 MAG: hypothetical protein AN486_14510 [Anabaena sp. AL93]